MITFQELLRRLSKFWEDHGCITHQGYDVEVGAGTFNPATFLRCLGPEPYNASYIEPCRRPTDGRYGTNPNRVQHYFQFQVVLKPSPLNIQNLYLQSLEAIGFDLSEHDIRFVHDDWEAPTLSAWGLGWEVWMDGMEVTQFTYFQSLGGQTLAPVTGELTYGLERLAMYLQKVNSIFDLKWDEHLTYGDIYHRNEVEWSGYNFDHATIEMWLRHFDDYENEAKEMMKRGHPIPAYDFVMKASHAFNLLDARGAISVTERTGYIARIRELARLIAEAYLKSREELNYPLMKKFPVPELDTSPKLPEISDSLLKATPKDKADYLLEIGSEELPATFVPIGMRNLKKEITALLESEKISYDEIDVFGTPRRLAVLVKGLSKAKGAVTEKKRGPAVAHAFDASGKLTKAGKGFLRDAANEDIVLSDVQAGKFSQLTIEEVKGTPYLFSEQTEKGAPTAKLLQEQLASLVLNLEFPKKMRWSSLQIAYARPLRWIVSLFGEDVVPFAVGNVVAGRETQGHPQLDKSRTIALKNGNAYLETLRQHYVLADCEERRNSILSQLDRLEQSERQIIERDAVIPQVLHLTEWPQLMLTTFDERFLKAPKEVLVSEMVEHQKYFPVATLDGSLRNEFVITADTKPSPQIAEGNQKVLSSRLSDGVFLYEQDLQIPLENWNEKLKHVTFQKKLGSVYEKVERLVEHTAVLHHHLNFQDFIGVKRTAELSKADLASAMVYEFPDLQGIMGKYYALAHGEKEQVALAIEEHWFPKGENAPLPETEAGIAVSLADKIDNLLGFFAIGLKPTSSSDPYALRRQVLGLIKILIVQEIRVPIMDIMGACLHHFPPAIQGNREEVLKEIEEFLGNRMKTIFLDYGFLKDETAACLSNGVKDIYESYCQVKALHAFRKTPEFEKLYEVYKRAKGQLTEVNHTEFSSELLSEAAEKDLDALLNTHTPSFQEAITSHSYDQAFHVIAQIQPGLARLFEDVKILADDPAVRKNRLALLHRVFALFSQLLDFQMIQER